MKIDDIKKYLSDQRNPPSNSSDQQKWLGLEEALQFLLEATDDMVPIYVSCNGFFVYGLVVPEDAIRENYIDDLMGWNFCVSGGYGYGTSFDGEKSTQCLFDPMDHTGSEILNGSLPVFFLRHFEGHEPSSFLEVNQKISHVLGLFWIDERKGFCKINSLGDYYHVATIDHDESLILCTLSKEELDFYLFLSKSVLIRVFDVSRSLDWMKYRGDNNRKEEFYRNEKYELYCKRTRVHDEDGRITTAWLRGFQIIRCSKSHDYMMKILNGDKERKYESFLIWDWKNKRICEWSSNPKTHGNYFVQSDLPYQTSPAFFRPEILLKYKQDPSKYKINSRKITCRAAWSINYDINSEGQLHAYICDLAHLPYEEPQKICYTVTK